jgi:hypothetical protein
MWSLCSLFQSGPSVSDCNTRFSADVCNYLSACRGHEPWCGFLHVAARLRHRWWCLCRCLQWSIVQAHGCSWRLLQQHLLRGWSRPFAKQVCAICSCTWGAHAFCTSLQQRELWVCLWLCLDIRAVDIRAVTPQMLTTRLSCCACCWCEQTSTAWNHGAAGA